MMHGLALPFAPGGTDGAIESLNKAIRLDPLDPRRALECKRFFPILEL
jgi:hypothetical protein